MKKLVLVCLSLLIFLVPISSAQEDGGFPSCTSEEFAEFATALGEGLAEIGNLVSEPDEPTAANLTELVVVFDAFNYGYWEGFYEAEPACAEAYWLGLSVGLLLDEQVITGQLLVLSVHEAEAGNEDVAEALLELASLREEGLEAGAEILGQAMTGIMMGEAELDFELPFCEEDELEATYEGLAIIGEAYEELGILTEVADGADLSVLIAGYATLSASYWAEFIPVVPMCFEAQNEAITVGLIIDESLIVVSNLRLAELSSEAGNDEVADVLFESALIRLDDLNAAIDYYYGEEDAAG